MAKVITDTKYYTEIAEYIQERLGVTTPYYPSEMREALDSIPTGYEANVYYGDSAPEDTSKLFIKGNKPTSLSILSNFYGSNEMKNGVGTLSSGIGGVGVASVGSKIYLFGGYTKSTFLNTIQVFDITTSSLTTLTATIPKKLACMSVGVVGSDIYLFGGYNGSSVSTIYKFNVDTETITTVDTTLPSEISTMGVAVSGSFVYLFGGCTYNPFEVTTDGSSKSIYRFDAANNTITTLSPEIYTSGVFGIAVATIGNKAYLFGGRRNTSTIFKTVWEFDMSTETIRTLGDYLPHPIFGMGAVGYNDKIYLFGGQIVENSSISYSNEILCFDVATQTVETLPTVLESSTMYIGTALAGTSAYLFGGVRSTYLDSINQYIIDADLPQNTVVIANKSTGTPCRIIDTDNMVIDISVEKVYRGNSDNIAEVETAYLYKNGEWVLVSGDDE